MKTSLTYLIHPLLHLISSHTELYQARALGLVFGSLP